MDNTNGPPIRQRIRDLENGWRIRESYGDTPNGIRRFDIHKGTAGGKGWQDAFYEDKETGQVWFLKDAKGNPTLAEVGISRWAGKGPAVPAERGCTECHKNIGKALASDPEFEKFQAELLTQLIAMSGDWGKKPTKLPTPVPAMQGPAGPQGPIGPPGPAGPAGQHANPATVITAIKEWLTENKELFAGPAGGKGDKGDKPTRDELLVLIREVVKDSADDLKGAKGDAADTTKLEVIFVDPAGKERSRFKFNADGQVILPPLQAATLNDKDKEFDRVWFTWGVPLQLRIKDVKP